MQSRKKNEIVAAAQKRLVQHGYAKVTMEEIAADLGVSKAALYYYFADKNEVFKAVFEKVQDAFLCDLTALLDSEMPAAKRLTAYFDLRLRLFHDYLTLAGFGDAPASELKSALRYLLADFRKKEIALVKRLLQLGVGKEFRKVNLGETAEMIVDVLHGLRMRHRFAGASYEEIEHNVKLLGESLLYGLLSR